MIVEVAVVNSSLLNTAARFRCDRACVFSVFTAPDGFDQLLANQRKVLEREERHAVCDGR